METQILIDKVEMLPASLKKEVEDFVDFLIFKNERHGVLFTQEATPTYGNVESNLSNQKKVKNTDLHFKPVFGSGKGIFGKIADDFDEPLDDMKGYM